MAVSDERLVRAVMSNLEIWIQDVTEIADSADHRRATLHLLRNMLQVQRALQRLMGDEENEREDVDEAVR